MSNLNALQLVNQALQELGLPEVPSIASSQDDETGHQTMALMNSLGNQLVRVHDWQFLEKVYSVTGDGVRSEFPLPDDWGRVVNQTEWSSRDKRPMCGPVNAQGWSWIQYGIVSVGTHYRYRILGNKFHVFPTPADGETMNLYYISKNWVFDSITEEYKSAVTSESDIPMFDDYMMIAGMKFKLWAAKGMDATVLSNEFNYMLQGVKAQNQGAPVIALDRRADHLLISYRNVPDGNFNV